MYEKLKEIHKEFFEDIIDFEDYIQGIQDLDAHIEFYSNLLEESKCRL